MLIVAKFFSDKMYKIIILFILIWLPLALCYAQQDTHNESEDDFLKYSEPESPEAPNIISVFLRMLASLLVILALITLGIFVFKRLREREAYNIDIPLSVLYRLPLGSKESICIVEIGEEVLIVGVTNHNISLLSKIEDEELIYKLKMKRTTNLSFPSTLMSYIKSSSPKVSTIGKNDNLDDNT